VSANYGSSGGAGGQIQYLPGGPSAGLEEYVNAATGGNQPSSNQLTAQAEIQPSAEEARRLGRVQAQLQALNANPTYLACSAYSCRLITTNSIRKWPPF